MTIYVLTLLIGVVAGLRGLLPPAVVSWAAYLGHLPLHGTWLAFLGFAATPYILTVLAVVELIADKQPKAPSRKAPPGFGARLVTGAVCGAAIGIAGDVWLGGLVAGIIGAVIGTLGGYAARMRLAGTFDRDFPAAIIEDLVAVVAAILITAAA